MRTGFARRVAIVLVAILWVSCTPGEDTDQPPSVDRIASVDADLSERLQRRLDSARKEAGSPGAQASVIWADGTTWAGSSGFANVRERARVGNGTLFAMGSTTKAYTAALVLSLAEDGVVSLDDPLARWVPDHPGAEDISLRQLLLHTSGLAQIAGSDVDAELEADGDHHLTVDELILDPVCSPGDCYHYQSPDYGLLGEVIERATGNTYSQELRTRFLEPLGLNDLYIPGQEPSRGPVAAGYGFGAPAPADEVASLRRADVDDPYPPAGGGLLATASDVASFADVLFAGDLLSATSLEEVVDFSATEDLPGIDECNAVGLGVTRGSLLGEETWGFGGFTGNFHSGVSFFPRYGLTVAVVVNDGGDTHAIIEALMEGVARAASVQRPGFRGGSCNYDVYAALSDGTRLRRLTTHLATDGGTVSWAPSGRKIAFASDRDGDAEIFVMTAGGAHETNVTTNHADDTGAAWSPHGSRIAFWSDRAGDNDIYVMDTDGTRVLRLTRTRRDDVLPSWSPDGSKIAFVSGRVGASHDLWVMKADGSSPRRLTRTDTDEWWPTWSPDGGRIAYVSDHRVVGGGGIAILTLATGSVRMLDVPLEGLVSPAWGPAGRVAFVDFTGDIWTATPRGSRLGRVTRSPGTEFGPGWSPDGDELAFPSERWQERRSR